MSPPEDFVVLVPTSGAETTSLGCSLEGSILVPDVSDFGFESFSLFGELTSSLL